MTETEQTPSETPHTITYESTGSGMMETLTPVCSCGWVGLGYAAYNDDRFTQLRHQEKRHLQLVTSLRTKGAQS